MRKKHWTESDFVVTETSPAYDGSDCLNRYGYCRVCKADMQSFGGSNKQGPIKHYSSHGAARSLGLWGHPKKSSDLRPSEGNQR